SARAFEILSISLVSIAASLSEKKPACPAVYVSFSMRCRPGLFFPVLPVTVYLDVHPSIVVTRASANRRSAGSLTTELMWRLFMKRFEGKVAVVTGGNSGIGL